MQQEEIIQLLKKQLEGTLSEEEQQRLNSWAGQDALHQALIDRLNTPELLQQELRRMHRFAEGTEVRWERIRRGMPEKTAPVLLWLKRAAVAAMLIGIAATAWLVFSRAPEKKHITRQDITDIAPGHAGAVLTLANGRQVVLDSMANGTVTTQNGAKVVIKGGKLVYIPAADGSSAGYNIISTPKGRQVSIVLPDGSTVWLNAASSLRFPVSFAGTRREVALSGEAYFDIAKNSNSPFVVSTKEMSVTVLGTQFNFNAYANEDGIRTTLLEGSILAAPVNGPGEGAILKPGQQAFLAHTGIQQVKQLDQAGLDKVTAWKNGFFNFEGATLEDIMKQLERWYDIEVVYEAHVPGITFFGGISRNTSLSGVLKGLEEAGVKFRLEEGKRLIITR